MKDLMKRLLSLPARTEIRFLAESVLEKLDLVELEGGPLSDDGHQAKVDLLAIISITEHEL